MRQFEREYQDALGSLRFSSERKEQIMKHLMEQNERKPAGRQIRPLRAVLIAACVVLALVVTAVAAVQTLRSRMVEDEHGVLWMSGGIVYYPAENLSEDLKALENQGDTNITFNSWEKAEEFIGLDLMNNSVLDASPATNYGRIITSEGKRIQSCFWVRVESDLGSIRAEGCYEIGNVDIDVEANLFTDNRDWDWNENFLGIVSADEVVTSRESYTTPSGLEVEMLAIDRGKEKRDSYWATFSLKGIPFVVKAHSKNSLVEAREALIQVLDGFTI